MPRKRKSSKKSSKSTNTSKALSSLVSLVITLGVLLFFLWFSRGYNIPGQNVITKVLVLLIMAYQAHHLRMFYARNVLLGLLIFYLPHMSSYAESGTYYPRSYLSLVSQTLLSVMIINIIAFFVGYFFFRVF
jgi:4-hydroxybenzoate polyprenyltransferase